MSDEAVEVLDGKIIKWIHTLGSMYDGDCIEIKTTDGNKYRLKVELLIPLLKKKKFTTHKAKVHTYLWPIGRKGG